MFRMLSNTLGMSERELPNSEAPIEDEEEEEELDRIEGRAEGKFQEKILIG